METMNTLVVTFSGKDRLGLVDGLSRVVNSHQGNWEESRMVRLADRFAGLLEIRVSSAKSGLLESALLALNSEDLNIRVERGGRLPRGNGRRRLSLSVTGADREGLVREVARTIAARKWNVESLESSTASAPMSGATLFRATIEVSAPRASDEEALREALEAISHELVVDIHLSAEGA